MRAKKTAGAEPASRLTTAVMTPLSRGVTLDPREMEILRTIVETYIETAEPVGSQAIAATMTVPTRTNATKRVSSATVRNVMARLDALGYLCSPHTSAGRVPTPMGLRFYLDSLLRAEPLSQKEQADIARRLSPTPQAPSIWSQISANLSQMAAQIGVCVTPRAQHPVYEHVEFVRVAPRRFVALFVTAGGLVHDRLFDATFDVSPTELEGINRHLREHFVGLRLDEMRRRIKIALAAERAHADALYRKALELSQRSLPAGVENEIYLEGAARILGSPELVSNVNQMRQLLQMLDEKSTLLKLLEGVADEARGHLPEPLVTLGSELDTPPLDGFALVTAGYDTPGGGRGVLGVLGPARMDYARLIPLVASSARAMTNYLLGF